jgi:FAD/FMN-containing dehydrogenase
MGYGELRNHVLGMTVVTGEGRTLELGGRVVKNVAGFDLLKPLVGSRGRLAVITSVCVRAFPRPVEDRLLVLRAESPRELCDVALAVGTAPILPVSSVMLAPARRLGAGAALLVRLHGAGPTVEADQRALERHCGVAFERAPDPGEVLTEARDHACEGPGVLELSVLPSRLGAAVAAIGDAMGDAELAVDIYLGRARMAAPVIDEHAAHTLRTAVAGLAGAIFVRSWGGVAGAGAEGASERAGLADPPSAIEGELVAGLERVFDPRGVFWPCRA